MSNARRTESLPSTATSADADSLASGRKHPVRNFFVISLSIYLLAVACNITFRDGRPLNESGASVGDGATAVDPEQDRTGRDRRAEREDRQEQRAEARRAVAAEQAKAVREVKQECLAEDGEPQEVSSSAQEVAVRCEVDSTFVALIGWDGSDIYWTRWWRIGTKPLRVSARAFSRRSAGSFPQPPAPPRPAIVSPPAPAPAPAAPSTPQAPPGYYSGNTGYTGPRCYAPGGVYWKPC